MMRRIAIALTLLFSCALAGATACPTGYTTILKIQVLPQSALSADISSWPTLFTGQDTNNATGNPHIKSTGNGGDVQSSGTDVVFCDAASGGNVIAYEFVPNSWSATAGTGEWWFLAPTIPKTSSTAFVYAMVGKASATDYSCLASGVTGCQGNLWNNFQLVYHAGYDNGSTHAITFTDSTGHATSPTNHGTIEQANTTFPPVNEAYQNSSTKNFDTGYALPALTSFSIELWISSGINANSQWAGGNVQSPIKGIAYVVDGGGTCAFPDCVGVYYIQDSSHYYSSFTTTSIGHAQAWHHFMATHTGGSSNQLALYLDGASATGNTYDSVGTATDPGTSTSNFWVGVSGANVLGTNNGVWPDELRVASVVISADKEKWDYTNQSSPSSVFTVTVTTAGGASIRHRISSN